MRKLLVIVMVLMILSIMSIPSLALSNTDFRLLIGYDTNRQIEGRVEVTTRGFLLGTRATFDDITIPDGYIVYGRIPLGTETLGLYVDVAPQSKQFNFGGSINLDILTLTVIPNINKLIIEGFPIDSFIQIVPRIEVLNNKVSRGVIYAGFEF